MIKEEIRIFFLFSIEKIISGQLSVILPVRFILKLLALTKMIPLYLKKNHD